MCRGCAEKASKRQTESLPRRCRSASCASSASRPSSPAVRSRPRRRCRRAGAHGAASSARCRPVAADQSCTGPPGARPVCGLVAGSLGGGCGAGHVGLIAAARRHERAPARAPAPEVARHRDPAVADELPRPLHRCCQAASVHLLEVRAARATAHGRRDRVESRTNRHRVSGGGDVAERGAEVRQARGVAEAAPAERRRARARERVGDVERLVDPGRQHAEAPGVVAVQVVVVGPWSPASDAVAVPVAEVLLARPHPRHLVEVSGGGHALRPVAAGRVGGGDQRLEVGAVVLVALVDLVGAGLARAYVDAVGVGLVEVLRGGEQVRQRDVVVRSRGRGRARSPCR